MKEGERGLVIPISLNFFPLASGESRKPCLDMRKHEEESRPRQNTDNFTKLETPHHLPSLGNHSIALGRRLDARSGIRLFPRLEISSTVSSSQVHCPS